MAIWAKLADFFEIQPLYPIILIYINLAMCTATGSYQSAHIGSTACFVTNWGSVPPGLEELGDSRWHPLLQ